MTESETEDERKRAQTIANQYAQQRAIIQAQRSGAMPVETLEALANDVLSLIAAGRDSQSETERLRALLRRAYECMDPRVSEEARKVFEEIEREF